MSGKRDDEIEGLANRLALLVTDTGEADNAGRAAGALARRMGLSGGDLKAIFMAGASAGLGAAEARRGGDRRAESPEVAALVRQVSGLRHNLKLAEVALRNAERERDAVRQENDILKATLDRRNTGGQVARILGTTIIAAIVVGIAYTVVGPVFREPPGPRSVEATPVGTPFKRAAIVRSAGARLYSQPNRMAAVVASVPPGTRLNVKRLVVNVLVNWAEVDFAGREGYVVSTDVDMP